jgi:TetR/AcrR family transcriptional repressor of bet genes
MSGTGPVRKSLRAEQKERTRQRLIDATLEVVAKEGLSGTTMGKVARRAGLSQGIVNFHFESKEQLLAETLTFLTEHYRTAWRAALDSTSDDPAAQIKAILHSLLKPEVAGHTHLACWFAYWGDAYARGIYRRIGSQVDEATAKAMEGLCAQLTDRSPETTTLDPKEIAANLVALVNGYWLMKLLRPDEVDLPDAARSCMSYLRGVFPHEFPETAVIMGR